MFKPSIITSFITNGFLSPAPALRYNKVQDCINALRKIYAEDYLGTKFSNHILLPIELYVFMEPDFHYLKEYLKKKLVLPNDTTLARFLGTLETDANLLDCTFELLSKRFQNLGVAPIAMASFFPEISHSNKVRNKLALQAVAGMQRLAQRFNEEDEWNIRAIEIVCGSRIEGLDIEEKKDTLISRLIPEEDVVNSLKKLIKGLHGTVENCDPKTVVPYALELEPGSLFLFNSAQSVTHIAELLKNSKHIGFNFDLSHYCLAGLLEQNGNGVFQLSQEITDSNAFDFCRKRIVHAHISDSSEKGHLGDLPFGAIHDEGYFRQQIQFLESVILKSNHSIPFTNHISLELEAVGRWREIQSSFQILCRLCRSISSQNQI